MSPELLSQNRTVPEPTKTAQETYSVMMKGGVAPRLRALGFKGSGQGYELGSDDYWAVLGFQKSAFSDRGHLRFTINVLVVSRAEWEAQRDKKPRLPRRPNANTFWGSYVWQSRIGGLLPGNEDLWWDVYAEADTRQLTDAVLWAVEEYALPAMRDHMQS